MLATNSVLDALVQAFDLEYQAPEPLYRLPLGKKYPLDKIYLRLRELEEISEGFSKQDLKDWLNTTMDFYASDEVVIRLH